MVAVTVASVYVADTMKSDDHDPASPTVVVPVATTVPDESFRTQVIPGVLLYVQPPRALNNWLTVLFGLGV
jgi:hypothetical protein